MKKNIRIIIIVCIAAALLAGAAVLLTLTAPEKEEDKPAEEETASSLLYDKNPADISKLTIENGSGSYEVVRIGEGDSAAWAVPAYANLPTNPSFINKLLENSATVTAQQTVTDAPEDISIYGLDAPSATVTAEFTDSANTVKKIIIGNKTPDENRRYFMLDGDPKVYTASENTLKYFNDDKHSVINKTVRPVRNAGAVNGTEEDSAIIRKLTVSRADLDYEIVIEYDTREDDENNMVANSSSYVMTAPVFRDLNPDKSTPITQNILALTASDFAVLNPVDSDYEKCGLNEPAAEITAETDSSTLRVRIGDVFIDEDGKKAGRFGCADGTDIIYIFNENSLPWLTFMPLEIVTSLYTSRYVYGLESLDITAGTKNMRFTFSGSDSKDFAAKLDGADTDTDKFKTLYQFILSAPSTELYFGEASGQPSLTVDIRSKDGGRDLIEFVPDGNRQAVVKLNGKSSYRCAEAYVERFIKNLELFEKGEDIITNW